MHEESDFTARRFDFSQWKRVLGYAKAYKKPLGVLAGAGAIVSLVDAAVPALVGLGIDRAFEGESPWGVAALYALVYGVLALSVYVFIYAAGKASTGIGHDLRRDGFARLQELSFSYYDKRSVGWLVTRLTSDCNRISGIISWFLLELVWGPLLIIAAATMMFVLDARLAGIVVLVVPALAGISWLFQRKLLASSREVRRWNSKVTADYNETLVGVRTLKMLGQEGPALDRFKTKSGPMRDSSVRNALQSALYVPMVGMVAAAGVGAALWWGGVRLGSGGETLSLGELIAFLQYAALFAMPVQDLARRFAELQAAQAAVERVTELLNERPSIVDSEAVIQAIEDQRNDPIPGRAPDGGPLEVGEIRFDNVSFAYEADEPVLTQLDLTVPFGQTVALVGPTGGGKSTIVSILARYYEVTGGAIVQGEHDIRERSLRWWQAQFGVVLQTPHLFSGTVADNIAYGRPTATREEITEAAKAAYAHDFICAMPEGYDSQVGEGGNKLSVGQRQLIAIARALVCDPQIVVLDEATASIDTQTEQRIQVGIDALLRGRTAFVIAHRLSTIERADRILFVEGGSVIEGGTHAELMALGGRYASLRQLHRPKVA